jgi:pyridoxamine 5'-phosphate oxidase
MNPAQDLKDLRVDYGREPLEETGLATDPIAQFRHWFDEAAASGIPEPNAMSLATADDAGYPSCRTVLLKDLDERGFVFFTNYTSRKGRHLATNPRAAILFPWIALERQVEVTGRVEKLDDAESTAYFDSRPRGSRIGAWVSNQSTEIPSRQFLLERNDAFEKRFASGPIPRPDFWGGFRVIPETIEFWQGGHDRLHDRFRYTKTGDSWIRARLSP